MSAPSMLQSVRPGSHIAVSHTTASHKADSHTLEPARVHNMRNGKPVYAHCQGFLEETLDLLLRLWSKDYAKRIMRTGGHPLQYYSMDRACYNRMECYLHQCNVLCHFRDEDWGPNPRRSEGRRDGAYNYVTLHCHQQNDFDIKMGSVASHFNVSVD